MGWQRRGTHAYYYQSVRINGRPRNAYVGPGDCGALAEALEADRRRRREADRAEDRRRREDLDASAREPIRADARAQALLAVALEAAGYHRHDRGPWRKRRMTTALTPALPPATPEAERDVWERASKGDRTALPQLRAWFDRDGPDLVERGRGDLARLAEERLLARACKDDLVLRESVRRKLRALRAELAGPDPTPLERLAVERVALCWAECHCTEVVYLEGWQGTKPKDLAHVDRIYHRAHRRYLDALRALAALRRLPPIVLNVAGQQQVNVAP